jgi:hypothetical protein
VQSKALSQYFVGTTLALIQMHSFSEKLNPVMPGFLFSEVAITSLLYIVVFSIEGM